MVAHRCTYGQDGELTITGVMRRSLLLVALLAVVAVPAAAQPIQHADGPTKPAPQAPLDLFADGFAARWIEDADFVYGPALLDFDVRAYLATAAPHLVPHAAAISHWAGHYSISPKVLLALLEMQSSAVSNAVALADPSAGLVAGNAGEQIRNLLMSLFVDFYAFREASAGQPRALNAATFALLNLFRSAAPAGISADVADVARTRFLDAYTRLFPSPALAAVVAEVPGGALPPSNFLQFPWKNNSSWFFNGTHTTSGSGSSPMSSIDFTRTWSLIWGNSTSTDYVVAAHAGVVTKYSDCNVRVTAPNGFSTQYYHLEGVVVLSGQQVTANQTIGVYADDQASALCQGGSSTGPHVHFSLLEGGVYASLDGVQLSNFLVHAGRTSYDSDHNYMWLQSVSTGTRYYAYETALLSTPTASGVPGAPTSFAVGRSGLNLTMTWVAPLGGNPAADYVLEASATPTFSPVLVGPLAVGSGTATGLTAPVGIVGTYYLRVSARNASGTGPASNVVSVTFTSGSSVPGPPGTPVVQVLGTGAIVVSWPAPTSGPAPTAYRAHLTYGGATLPGSPITLPALTSIASPGPLTPGNYTIALSAVAGAAEGPTSAATPFVIPGACTAAPAAAGSFAITKLGGLNVRLTWTAPAAPNPATTYRLQAAMDPGFAAIVLDTDVGNTTLLDVGAVPGTFYVRVVAVNTCGMAAPSNQASVSLP